MLTTILAMVLTLLLPPTNPRQPPDRCKVVGGTGQCLVDALDPGRSGRPQPHRPRREAPSPGTADAPVAPPPPPLYPTGPAPGALGQAFLPELDAPDPPAGPPPAILAQRAIELLGLDGPTIHTSATDTAFVGVPLWLWIDSDTGPVSATATAGAAQVTATGRLTAVEWDLGPAGAHIRCPSSSTPWTGQAGASPDCGYTYQQRSLPERTNGTGRWPITATSVWQVEWAGTSAGAPVTGTETVRITSQTSLAVGEVQVLVTGS